MANTRCALCDCALDTVEFDLRKSSTLYSQTCLMLLLQSCFPEQFCITDFAICKMCYFLLNELDSIKLRTKAIEDQLKNYMSKYFMANHMPKNDIIADKTEECTVCVKKISSRTYKSHLKTYHPDVEPSFNFDVEVNSISAMNPSGEAVACVKVMNNSTKKTRKKDTDNPKPFECVICSKSWRTAAELKNHMVSHSKERPYICEICGQAYKRQRALAIHVGMHNGVNPFTCVYCNKSFTQKGALVRHTPIHTGELPFQCDICGKRFVHHTSFNTHKLSHTGQKSYKCEVCGLLLLTGSHLKRHMKVHTGEKKYICNTCGKKFAERYNLAVHEKQHRQVKLENT